MMPCIVKSAQAEPLPAGCDVDVFFGATGQVHVTGGDLHRRVVKVLA
jgi:hypothetical protein